MIKLNEDLFEAEDEVEILDDVFIHPGTAFYDDFGKKWVFDEEFADAYDYYVWSAIDEEGNTKYFVIDQNFYVDAPEDEFYKIVQGPLKTYEEAQEVFGEIIDSIEEAEEDYEDDPDKIIDKLAAGEYDESLKEDFKKFQFDYSVNGKKTTDTISATSIQDAEKLIKDKYKDQPIFITKKVEIKEDFDGNTSEETPEPGVETGIAGLLIKAINDEWNTIDYYNTVIATISQDAQINAGESIIDIMKDITAEENNHVGMLQKALALVSPNTDNIKAGEKEAEEKIEDEVK